MFSTNRNKNQPRDADLPLVVGGKRAFVIPIWAALNQRMEARIFRTLRGATVLKFDVISVSTWLKSRGQHAS